VLGCGGLSQLSRQESRKAERRDLGTLLGDPNQGRVNKQFPPRDAVLMLDFEGAIGPESATLQR
jgi:hypothetical protein